MNEQKEIKMPDTFATELKRWIKSEINTLKINELKMDHRKAQQRIVAYEKTLNQIRVLLNSSQQN